MHVPAPFVMNFPQTFHFSRRVHRSENAKTKRVGSIKSKIIWVSSSVDAHEYIPSVRDEEKTFVLLLSGACLLGATLVAMLRFKFSLEKWSFSSRFPYFPFFMYWTFFTSFTNSFLVAFRYRKSAFHPLPFFLARWRFSHTLLKFSLFFLSLFLLPGTGELKGKLHNKSAFNFIFSDFFSVRHSQKKDDTKKFATRPNWNVNTTETRKWAKFCSWREEKRGKSRKIRRVSMCGWREENERKCREWCINI